MRDYVYQMFILGCDNLTQPLKNNLGGVIFFSKDITDKNHLVKFIKEIKNNAKTFPFLSIDQEGGRVERTENIRPKRLSAKYAYEKGIDFLKEQSEEISKELYELGFNLNFAPCVDVNTNPDNPIIGERAFSSNTDDVTKGMNIFVTASRNNHIIPCVKHFPGHGDANKDSHLTLPQIDLEFEEYEEKHIKPFKEAIKNNIEMIMVAHLHCTCFDKETIPSSLSKNVVNYLRKDLNYNGVLISDDMIMKGVQQYGSVEACKMGILAGLDMFIYRNSTEETINIIEELIKEVEKDDVLQKKVLQANERIKNLKQRYKLL